MSEYGLEMFDEEGRSVYNSSKDTLCIIWPAMYRYTLSSREHLKTYTFHIPLPGVMRWSSSIFVLFTECRSWGDDANGLVKGSHIGLHHTNGVDYGVTGMAPYICYRYAISDGILHLEFYVNNVNLVVGNNAYSIDVSFYIGGVL